LPTEKSGPEVAESGQWSWKSACWYYITKMPKNQAVVVL